MHADSADDNGTIFLFGTTEGTNVSTFLVYNVEVEVDVVIVVLTTGTDRLDAAALVTYRHVAY